MARELSYPGTFALKSIRSQEHFAPWNFLSLLVGDVICDIRLYSKYIFVTL